MMISAVLLTFALLIGALAAAMVTGWRRWARAPAHVAARIEGPTCYPRVKR